MNDAVLLLKAIEGTLTVPDLVSRKTLVLTRLKLNLAAIQVFLAAKGSQDNNIQRNLERIENILANRN
jgi:hypothetical protein